MSSKAHEKYRKTRPARFELTCSEKEKAMIYELAKLLGKKKNQMIIDMVREKLEEVKSNADNTSYGIDPSDCIEAFYPDYDDDMTDGQFSDWLFRDDYC